MPNEKKYLDYEGLQHLWSKISMEDYPNNDTLIAVINAIDENKADKEYVDEKIPVNVSELENDAGYITADEVPESFSGSWNDLEDKPFGEFYNLTIISESVQTEGFVTGPKQGYEHPNLTDNVFSTALIIGDTYIVTFNGVEYEGVAQKGPRSQYYHDAYLFANSSATESTPVTIYTAYVQGSPILYFSTTTTSEACPLIIKHREKNTKILDSKFIAEDIARVSEISKIISEGSTENQILATDEKGNLNWEDKAFCEVIQKMEYGGEITKTSIYGSGQPVNGTINPNGGINYIVNFDEERIFAQTVEKGTGADAIIYLGNLSLCNAGEDNGLPFCVKKRRTDSSAYCYVKGASAPMHTIEAFPYTLAVKTLDEKYIPDTIARVEDITQFEIIEVDGSNYTNNYYNIVKQAYDSGKTILIKFKNSSNQKEYLTPYVHVTDENFYFYFLKDDLTITTASYQKSGSGVRADTNLENSLKKLKNWNPEKTGSEDNYPSVKAMEDYVNENIPVNVSELENDAGYITSYTETDPTVPAWAKEPTKPTYTASEVGADPSGTASSAVSTHNTSTSAHNDIRDLISGLTTRLNALADSDDTTLDQMSEIVAYIKSNKTLIENVTTNKVNVSDIIDNLTTNVSTKPLSAAQGVELKALIDAIVVPTNVSAFTNDAGYLTEHQDLSNYATKEYLQQYVEESILGGEW